MSVQSLMSIQSLSLTLLLVGIGLAFSHIRLSGWILGWILFSGALLLQGFRSMLRYVAEHGGVDASTYTLANDWMGLGFSLLIVASMHLMREVYARHRLAAESLRALSTAANDATIVMDDTGTIAVWNQAAQRIFGYSKQEAQGKNLRELIVPERCRIDFENMFDDLGSDGAGSAGSTPTDLAGLRKDRTEIVTEYSIFRVRVDGKWHVIYIVRDITERKRKETLIRGQNTLLLSQKAELEATLGRIRRLEGLLSICMTCKKIRGESNAWQQLEHYLGSHTDAVFSHGLCPECFEQQKMLLD